MEILLFTPTPNPTPAGSPSSFKSPGLPGNPCSGLHFAAGAATSYEVPFPSNSPICAFAGGLPSDGL